ncbi:hypothetical protein JCM11491_006839 [Sporobolomyces phaffii]
MIPSTDLPPIPGRSSPASLRSTLEAVRSAFLAPAIIDLRPPLEVKNSQGGTVTTNDGTERDEFELRFLREWLERVVKFGLKQPASDNAAAAGEEEGIWETIVDEASAILAGLGDDQAETTYILPSPPESRLFRTAASNTTIEIRNHTLVSSTTGHRTWGSAPILARRMAVEPDRFFPTHLRLGHLKVLELGSGTGLVGISAISVLDNLGFQNATVVLSDGGETNLDPFSTNGILSNLRLNVDNHRKRQERQGLRVRSEVRSLVWGNSPARDSGSGGGGGGGLPHDARYDVLLGADLVYEPSQGIALRQAVVDHLRFPDSSASSGIAPAFHLVIPLRPTHKRESELVDTLFPSPSHSSPSSEVRPPVTQGSNGKRWNLVSKEREDLAAPDGFGTRRGRNQGEAVISYRRWRIEWVEVASA